MAYWIFLFSYYYPWGNCWSVFCPYNFILELYKWDHQCVFLCVWLWSYCVVCLRSSCAVDYSNFFLAEKTLWWGYAIIWLFTHLWWLLILPRWFKITDKTVHGFLQTYISIFFPREVLKGRIGLHANSIKNYQTSLKWLYFSTAPPAMEGSMFLYILSNTGNCHLVSWISLWCSYAFLQWLMTLNTFIYICWPLIHLLVDVYSNFHLLKMF